MRFRQIDQITEITPGESITAVKRLSPDEEYLKDHFPHFPVMPGVLMLEAMYQASMWLVRRTEDFAHAVVVLAEARNVKFSDFVEPGQVLNVTANWMKDEDSVTTLKTHGIVVDAAGNSSVAVGGRLLLERYNLEDRYPARAASDPFLRRRHREMFLELTQGIGQSVP